MKKKIIVQINKFLNKLKIIIYQIYNYEYNAMSVLNANDYEATNFKRKYFVLIIFFIFYYFVYY